MPRRYRGMDSFWWLDQIGAFDRTIDQVDDIAAARREPSLQLVGRPDHATLDLASLHSVGVRLVGRLQSIEGRRVCFAPDLRTTIAAADERMQRVLDRIDEGIDRLGLRSEVLPPERAARVELDDVPESIDLGRDGITSVVWATGHIRRYGWLDLPLLDAAGEIRQRRGVTPVAGAYVLGQRFQHYRNSNFIDGVGRDAEFVADHICRRSTALPAHPSIRSRQS
jgi:putative flavoprotein involved in K+ transport